MYHNYTVTASFFLISNCSIHPCSITESAYFLHSLISYYCTWNFEDSDDVDSDARCVFKRSQRPRDDSNLIIFLYMAAAPHSLTATYDKGRYHKTLPIILSTNMSLKNQGPCTISPLQSFQQQIISLPDKLKVYSTVMWSMKSLPWNITLKAIKNSNIS